MYYQTFPKHSQKKTIKVINFFSLGLKGGRTALKQALSLEGHSLYIKISVNAEIVLQDK